MTSWCPTSRVGVENVYRFSPTPPGSDRVCEVVSPSTESIDRGRKLRIYAREGVSHLRLVNPLAKILEVYRLSDGKWTLLQTSVNDEVVQAEPFGNVSIEMSRWWLPEAPPERG